MDNKNMLDTSYDERYILSLALPVSLINMVKAEAKILKCRYIDLLRKPIFDHYRIQDFYFNKRTKKAEKKRDQEQE